MTERPGRTAQWAHLVLLWCAWLNVAYDELEPDALQQVHRLASRVLDEDLPEIARSTYGVPS